MEASRLERMMIGAAAYAAADKSDPFAYARAVTHTRNGVASIDGSREAFYEAERFSEERTLSDGTSFNVTSYKNAKRP